MFDIAPSELMLVAAVALVVIGPKDLPRALHVVGRWVGRARGMARHFRVGIDEIIRQAEMEEMEKKWAAENARIMAEHPSPPPEEAHDAIAASSAPLMENAEASEHPEPAVHDPDLERMLAASTEQMTPLPAPPPAEPMAEGLPVPSEPSPAQEPELPFAVPAAKGERE